MFEGYRVGVRTRTRVFIAVGGVIIAAIAVFILGRVVQTHKTDKIALNEPVTALEIKVSSASVTLTDAAEVSVTRKTAFIVSKPSTSETIKDGTLNIKGSCSGFRLGECSIAYVIAVPANVPVHVITESGSVITNGLKADFRAVSESGAFKLDDNYGFIDVKSESGAIDATAISSRDVTAHSDSGAVNVKFAASPNNVDALTTSGAIHVTVPKSSTTYRVSASSESGETTSSIARATNSPYTITAKSDSGNVRVDTSK